jgi:2-oxoglutarate ferredoxin oxidoreductase subunit beta
MTTADDYGKFETAWCPGCGNAGILKSLKKALAEMDIPPHKLGMVSGIGQAAKTPQYMNCNMFNGLHGRSLPAGQGAKLANPELTVIVESGDGCSYGEGGNHFLAAVRRNVDITLLAHDNQIYGLTKGQASPTTAHGQKTKAQPFGAPSDPFNPVMVATAMQAGFVARAFSGDMEHLTEMIKLAVQHKGFSMVDILQPCVSFNKVNTFKWYKDRCYRLEDHDPTDWAAAMEKASEFGDSIPIGVIWKSDKPVFGEDNPAMDGEPLATRKYDKADLEKIIQSFA